MSAPWTYHGGTCEVCDHYANEGIVEGVCQDCRDADPETYADLDEDDGPHDCGACQGTGIGRYGDPDTSKCGRCHGTGVIRPKPEPDEPDFESITADREARISERDARYDRDGEP